MLLMLMLMLDSGRPLSAGRCQAAPRQVQGGCLDAAQARCCAMLLLLVGCRVHNLLCCQVPGRQLRLWAEVDV